MSTIGTRIKEIRAAEDLTQQEFADKIGISRANIANYEKDLRSPVDAAVKLICEKFNVNEEWLRTGKGKRRIPVSKEEELAKIFGPIMAGDTSTKSRMITAFAKLPDELYGPLADAAVAFVNNLMEDAENKESREDQ